MTRQRCEWCGGLARPGTTCPRSLTCPRCAAQPGHPCKRPSGHRAGALHSQRVALAERIDLSPNPPLYDKESS